MFAYLIKKNGVGILSFVEVQVMGHFHYNKLVRETLHA